MGWIRFACGNGLFVGRATASMRRPHVQSLRVEDIPGLIARGFEAAQVDSTHWQERAQVRISPIALNTWIDDVVTKKWGVLAAARTLHIAQTGFDGRFADPREKAPASHRTVAKTLGVPGSEPPNDNVFRIGQVLAWIANSPSESDARDAPRAALWQYAQACPYIRNPDELTTGAVDGPQQPTAVHGVLPVPPS